MKNIVYLFILLLFFNACQNDTKIVNKYAKTKDVIILFSSDMANLYQDQENFIKLNKQNILNNGDKINYKIVSLEDNTVKSFKKVLENKNLVGIISFLESRYMLEFKEAIEKAEIPIIATIATHSDINKIKFVSRICLNDIVQGHVAASFLRDELFISNVSILRDSKNIFSTELTNIFITRYRQITGKIDNVFDTKSLKNEDDFIKKLKNSNVETIYAVAGSDKIKQLLEILKKEKLNIKILSNDGLLSAFQLKYPTNTHLLNGVLVVDNYADNVVSGNSYDALIYDASSLLTKAFNNCSMENNICVNDYMRNLKSFKGAVNKINMKDGNAYRSAYVNKILDDEMHIIVKVH